MRYKNKLPILILMSLLSSQLVASQLDETIIIGSLLTQAVKEKAYVKLKKLPDYKAIKQYLSKNKCAGFKYRGYIVDNENKQYFYLVASKGKNIIIGRHFKAPMSDGAIKIDEFESSTNGCLNLGSSKSNVAAMYATHLKPFPNEFHLLQSNLKSISLYIGTSKGMYVVENGTMVLSESK